MIGLILLPSGYESQFDKKAFSGELELVDLDAFFKECDLYPSGAEIEEGLDVITHGNCGLSFYFLKSFVVTFISGLAILLLNMLIGKLKLEIISLL